MLVILIATSSMTARASFTQRTCGTPAYLKAWPNGSEWHAAKNTSWILVYDCQSSSLTSYRLMTSPQPNSFSKMRYLLLSDLSEIIPWHEMCKIVGASLSASVRASLVATRLLKEIFLPESLMAFLMFAASFLKLSASGAYALILWSLS